MVVGLRPAGFRGQYEHSFFQKWNIQFQIGYKKSGLGPMIRKSIVMFQLNVGDLL